MSDGRVRTILQDWIPERTTPRLSFTCRDEDGNVVTSVDSATLTIVTAAGAEVTAETDIFEQIAAGVGALRLSIEDTQIVAPIGANGQQVQKETHIAHIHWTWDGGTKHGRHDIVHTVYNALVPE